MKTKILLSSLTLLGMRANSEMYREDTERLRDTSLALLPDFDCVGELLTRDESADASCILISEKCVITAAHLVVNTEKKAEQKQINGMSITMYTVLDSHTGAPKDFECRLKGTNYKVKKITIHPGYLDATTIGNCDIAILELEERAEGIKPALLNHEDELAIHKKVVGVGYGESGKANIPEDVYLRRKKIAGENTINSIGGFIMDGRMGYLIADFGHSGNKRCNPMGDDAPCELDYMVGGEKSGGGLFYQSGNEWRLAGIGAGATTDIQALLTTGYYGQTMWWTNVIPFLTWIKEISHGAG